MRAVCLQGFDGPSGVELLSQAASQVAALGMVQTLHQVRTSKTPRRFRRAHFRLYCFLLAPSKPKGLDKICMTPLQ